MDGPSTDVRADDFLAGPRGRAVCVAHLGQVPGTPRGWQMGFVDGQPPQPALADATTRAMYWQDPEDFELDGLPPDASSAIRRAAEELAAHPDTSWWDEPAVLENQHVVAFDNPGRPPLQPRLFDLRAGIDALAENEHDITDYRDARGRQVDWQTTSGIWWSAPIATHGVHSSRALGIDTQPLGLTCVEDELGWERADSWPIEPVETPRLFELTDPAEWVRLCRDYPLDVTQSKRGDWWRATGRDGRWVMPDWPSVARDWDGVHLTVRGYLTTAGRALDVDDEHASVLAGWDPDATFWLNDVLRLAGRATHWQRDEDGEWHPFELGADS